MLVSEAERLLGIDPGTVPSVDTVNLKFRVKAAANHPDKGGSRDQFAKLVTAKEVMTAVALAKPKPIIANWSKMYDAAQSDEQQGSEKKFQQSVMKMLKKRDAKVWKIHGHMMQATGMPDLYVADKQWAGWLELKWAAGKLKPIQRHQLKELNERGVAAFCVTGCTDGTIEIEHVPTERIVTIRIVEDLIQTLRDMSKSFLLRH